MPTPGVLSTRSEPEPDAGATAQPRYRRPRPRRRIRWQDSAQERAAPVSITLVTGTRVSIAIFRACVAAALVCLLPVLVRVTAAGVQSPSGYALTLVDLDGRQNVLARVSSPIYAPRVSPDGTRVAFETRDGSPEGSRVWVASLSDMTTRQALSRAGAPVNAAPLWTPDGERLLFVTSGSPSDAVFWRRADGGDDAQHLVDAHGADGWNGAGALRVLTRAAGSDYDLALFDLAARTLTPLVDVPRSTQHSSDLSPDGRWLAYASNETGRDEVWLEPSPRTTVRYRITRAGGSRPQWADDGRSIFFDRDRQLFQVMLNLDGPAPIGDPTPLPIKGFVQAELRRQYDLLPNGRDFLVVMPSSD